jgi:pimeloyl-ACP methyl ester carboxylesterase
MLLNYTDDGPGPVVVLLHGFPLDHSLWDAQRGSLGSVYRLICPDLRGFGKTAAPEGVYTMDAMADDVVEMLDALGLTEPVVLGGLSMGGYVALSVAARYPGRLRGLMLLSTRATADTEDAAEARRALARDVEQSGSAARVVESMLPRLFSPLTFERRPQVVEQTRAVMDRTVPRAIVGALRGMAVRPDRTADLPRLDVPTLVVAGEQDAIIPVAEARAMADAIPRATLVTIPESGHLAPMEAPAATDDAIGAFLASIA